MKKWNPARYLALMTDPDIGITHTAGVPVEHSMSAELPEFASATFPALQVAVVGDAPTSHDLLEVWAAKGVYLAQSDIINARFNAAASYLGEAR